MSSYKVTDQCKKLQMIAEELILSTALHVHECDIIGFSVIVLLRWGVSVVLLAKWEMTENVGEPLHSR